MAEQKTSEEPFLLSVLPFAGLGLLLLLAVVWRFLPRDEPAVEPPPPSGPTAEERAALVVANFEQMPQREIALSSGDFSLGPTEAAVTVVEFSDFECPYCRRGAKTVQEVLATHPGDVRLVFKNFPIDMACHEELQQQLHPFACKAALFAHCAGQSNPTQFWRAHDLLFAAGELSDDVMRRILVELSLPGAEMDRCMGSQQALRKVKEDIAMARGLGVTGTPTFFINGRRAPEYDGGALLTLVEHALAGR
ncbi:MAG TPA: thioredoxin domain-containing protein [Vicinamibacteria bacterium]|nr:thioredoxin domain-containing protein [Vicinamibacteria bacterium]